MSSCYKYISAAHIPNFHLATSFFLVSYVDKCEIVYVYMYNIYVYVCRYECSFTYVNFSNPINERGKPNFKQTSRIPRYNDTIRRALLFLPQPPTHVMGKLNILSSSPTSFHDQHYIL